MADLQYNCISYLCTVPYVADCRGNVIIVKNVPCEECEQCGEKYFSNEVALRLEAIVNSVKAAMLDTAIVEYTPAA